MSETMTADRMSELVVLAKAGDVVARNAIVVYMYKLCRLLAFKILRRCNRLDLLDDAVQDAIAGVNPKTDRAKCGGIFRAIQHYDASKGLTFEAYSRYWILNEIRSCVSRSYGVDTSTYTRMVAIRRTADLLERELGRRPTAIEVQARLPTKARRYSVENNLRVVAGVSREVELTEASTASFAETDTIDESDIVNAIDRRRQIDTMSMALAGLTVRQQQMLSMLYGLDGAELDNDAELARAIGRSRQVVNFHKKRAIKMLRRRMVVEGSAVGAKK